MVPLETCIYTIKSDGNGINGCENSFFFFFLIALTDNCLKQRAAVPYEFITDVKIKCLIITERMGGRDR